QVYAVADVTGLVSGGQLDAGAHARHQVVLFEGAAEAVVAGLRQLTFDDHVVGDRRDRLCLPRLVGEEPPHRPRQLVEDAGGGVGGDVAVKVVVDPGNLRLPA